MSDKTMSDDTLRAILAGMRRSPVHITADRCTGDIRAVEAFCDLIRAAPALAAEVLRLRDVIAGRTVPPTAEEVEAHHAAGGAWLLRWPWRDRTWASAICWRGVRDEWQEGAVCIALDEERKPCAWPVGGGR